VEAGDEDLAVGLSADGVDGVGRGAGEVDRARVGGVERARAEELS
jgi:hypothetical protein